MMICFSHYLLYDTDIHIFICFLTLFTSCFLVFFALFELNIPCFFLKNEKEEECQNLLFLASSVKVGLYLWKPGTKEEKLRNDFMKLYLQNHEKIRTSWLNLVKTWRKKQEENIGLLGHFSGNWQPDLPKKIGLERKVVGVFWESCLLQSFLKGLQVSFF